MTKALVVASLWIQFSVLLFKGHIYIAYGKVNEIIGHLQGIYVQFASA
ncbi:hypothetical protein [Desulfosporosinus hippei]|uniref:Uncharacterized protein n=1 Tax=Desulfosporosinus hippei DSM 8344 TaxID=1121419 RepID=A0A1G8E7K2_9FIRM|nr:hypothetical protein [Desulfosporosinus hippei]SDH65936.1 hypothetical protein SAMN05443529_11678 [Desulfosporosinus hippei DSM 8344]